MKRHILAGLTLATAAVIVGCGGGGPTSTPPVQSRGASAKPDGTATFTLTLPQNLVRATHAGRRSPRFVDPTTGTYLYISVSDYQTSTFSCVAVTGDPTQPVTIPVYSAGGTISIQEYDGKPASCGGSGSHILAQVQNVGYSSFAPGSTITNANTLLSAPLTLSPLVSEIIVSQDNVTYYNTNTNQSWTGMSPLNPCGTHTFYMLGADFFGVSSPGAQSGYQGANPQYGYFPIVTVGTITVGGGATATLAFPGAVNMSMPSPAPSASPFTSTVAFSVTATDVFGGSVTDNYSFSCP